MLVVLVGPTMSGKTTLMKELVKDNRIEKLITHTTRPKRKGEVDGEDYHFHDKFVHGRNVLAPREYEAINNNDEKEKWTYWINKRDIKRDVVQVVVLDPQGLEDLKKTVKNVHTVLLNPDIAIIDSRIEHSSRSDENINETNRRLFSDLFEIALWEKKLRENGDEFPIMILTGENVENNKKFVLEEVFGGDEH